MRARGLQRSWKHILVWGEVESPRVSSPSQEAPAEPGSRDTKLLFQHGRIFEAPVPARPRIYGPLIPNITWILQGPSSRRSAGRQGVFPPPGARSSSSSSLSHLGRVFSPFFGVFKAGWPQVGKEPCAPSPALPFLPSFPTLHLLFSLSKHERKRSGARPGTERGSGGFLPHPTIPGVTQAAHSHRQTPGSFPLPWSTKEPSHLGQPLPSPANSV